MPRRSASTGLPGARGWPSSSTLPWSGATRPETTLMRVDLPAPFWPRRQCTSPARDLEPGEHLLGRAAPDRVLVLDGHDAAVARLVEPVDQRRPVDLAETGHAVAPPAHVPGVLAQLRRPVVAPAVALVREQLDVL